MTSFDKLTPGLTDEREVTVEEKHTVSHTGKPVLSTPIMISLMEWVAMSLVQPLLPSGYTTVGYEVHVRHKAPAPVGAVIRVGCRLLDADGRKLMFEVRVQEGEKLIGEGIHRRTVIQVSG
jgi:fluoroacetyl-CoA thioesterase